MKDKIKRILSKIFGNTTYFEPLVDKTAYPAIEEGYAGGSLADSNVLVVADCEDIKEEAFSLLKREKAYVNFYHIHSCDELDLSEAEAKFIGKIDHIINIVSDKDKDVFDGAEYNNEDANSFVYLLLKKETDYLAARDRYSTLTTAFLHDESESSELQSSSIAMCIRGLGKVLSNHHIINNGLVASSKVPIKDIVNTACFLASKYGQVMSGEVIRLK